MLVATDVAARGIHVDDIGVVVHYDLRSVRGVTATAAATSSCFRPRASSFAARFCLAERTFTDSL